MSGVYFSGMGRYWVAFLLTGTPIACIAFLAGWLLIELGVPEPVCLLPMLLIGMHAPLSYYWFERRTKAFALRGYLLSIGVPICLSCGYDCRGLRGRCPECGSIVPVSDGTTPPDAADSLRHQIATWINATTTDALPFEDATAAPDRWRRHLKWRAMVDGAVRGLIPIDHATGQFLPAVLLLTRLAELACGVGTIVGSQSQTPNILESEDFAILLARWVGEPGVSNAALSKWPQRGFESKPDHIDDDTMIAKVVATNAGLIVSGRVSDKLAESVANRIEAIVRRRARAAWIPIYGAVVGAKVSARAMREIEAAAESWYRWKCGIVLSGRAA